jgi:curved DNA-binding protein CbpA
MINYYKVLGVRPSAGADEIKRAYKQKARMHHPDANGGDPRKTERFQQINEAYQVLSNPERRAAYDREREAHERGRERARARGRQRTEPSSTLAQEVGRRIAAQALHEGEALLGDLLSLGVRALRRRIIRR